MYAPSLLVCTHQVDPHFMSHSGIDIITLCYISAAAYYKDKTLYVLFTGSNPIVVTGSVLCTFSIVDIEKAFTSDYRVRERKK